MFRTFRWALTCFVLALPGLWCPRVAAAQAGQGRVALWHLPDGAIQPQAAVDSKGVVHLIYYKADENEGNLYYVRLAPGQQKPGESIRVNSEPGSAGAIGTVRTAQIALGKANRVHVVWNGLGPKGANGYPVAYQAYARLNDAGAAFEPQRNLITWATGVDGGGSVAADTEGNVYVTWHALANAKDEAGRAIFVAVSHDDGSTFAREKQANPLPTGACGCCGLKALADRKGVLYILYRAAGDKVNRDTMLLVSRDRGETFTEKRIDRWNINACPMSTYSLTEGKGGILAAWETREQVYYSTINPVDLTLSRPISVLGAQQKHPFIASGANGQSLLVWTEGTGWQRGGALVWEVIDQNGTPMAAARKPDSIPVWGLATAYARPDGSFVIIY